MTKCLFSVIKKHHSQEMKRFLTISGNINHGPASKRRKLNTSQSRSESKRNYETRTIDLCNIRTKPRDYCVEIKENGLDLEYFPNFYSRKESKEMLLKLEKSVEYQNDEEASVIIYGKKHKIPRKQTAFGAPGTSYKFSGKDVKARPWNECSLLLDIKNQIEKHLLSMTEKNDENKDNDKDFELKNRFNFVLLNRYKDGNDRMGFHRDNEPDIKKYSSIAAISFGDERDIIFKHEDIISHRKKNKDNDKDVIDNLGVKIVKIKLHSGSLLIMRYPTNNQWYHEIPKRAKIKNVRVSLTYRNMIPRLQT